MIYITLYLLAIVTANLIVTIYGPGASIVNAFLLIGLDLTTRDRLHDTWSGQGLRWKMAMLITAGSLLSWLLNHNAGPIALASLVAFACAGLADAGIYHWLRDRPWFARVNGSNVVAAAVDSIIFPALAFGGVMPAITLGQFIAKVAGGAIWSLIIRCTIAPLREVEPSKQNA